eukprot:7223904-Prymnesium_polylepis.1
MLDGILCTNGPNGLTPAALRQPPAGPLRRGGARVPLRRSHPDLLVETTSLSFAELPKLSYGLHLPRGLYEPRAKNNSHGGALSRAQLETVNYASQARAPPRPHARTVTRAGSGGGAVREWRGARTEAHRRAQSRRDNAARVCARACPHRAHAASPAPRSRRASLRRPSRARSDTRSCSPTACAPASLWATASGSAKGGRFAHANSRSTPLARRTHARARTRTAPL